MTPTVWLAQSSFLDWNHSRKLRFHARTPSPGCQPILHLRPQGRLNQLAVSKALTAGWTLQLEACQQHRRAPIRSQAAASSGPRLRFQVSGQLLERRHERSRSGSSLSRSAGCRGCSTAQPIFALPAPGQSLVLQSSMSDSSRAPSPVFYAPNSHPAAIERDGSQRVGVNSDKGDAPPLAAVQEERDVELREHAPNRVDVFSNCGRSRLLPELSAPSDESPDLSRRRRGLLVWVAHTRSESHLRHPAPRRTAGD